MLDINMGCPVPKIVGNGEGSALMKTPELAAEKAKKEFQMEVKLQRVRFDMSQRELGETLGISSPQMSELLSDPDKLSVSRLRGIIRALDMDPLTILRLLGFTDKMLRDFTRDQGASLKLVDGSKGVCSL